MNPGAVDSTRPLRATDSRAHSAEEAARYHADRWWTDDALWDHIERHASARPDATAFVAGATRLTWAGYRDAAERLAGVLLATGLERGDRVAVWLPDGPTVHVAFVACELAGLVVVGIGARAGRRELDHLLAVTDCKALLGHATHRDADTAPLVAELRAQLGALVHVVVPDLAADPGAPILVDGAATEPPADASATLRARRFGPDELSMINSTSGTTGLPKCVMHTQNRWWAFHRMAVEAGDLSPDDVFCSAIPAPFGFGLWTAHYTPTFLGAPCVLVERFHPDELIRTLAAERVTVLACVSTQFIMMLASDELERHDLTALRVMFTGGEAVPYERAAAFEDRTGATVLQFYGSNETGAISRTTLRDSRDVRLRTAGGLIPVMQVRMFDEEGAQPTDARRGRPAGRGPACCLGYWGDAGANDQLFSADGWMLMGDVVELDDAGSLSVVGRTSDFIIRGGKNISAPVVEELVQGHPAIALAAAVAVADPVFGERVGVVVQVKEGQAVDLDGIAAHLKALGAGSELLPEHLLVVDEIPRSSGGKVAKGELRELMARHVAGTSA
jgi:acyl-CoA synthetase